jgi:hypothetical protein
MDANRLPEPSLAELARTTLARARAARADCACPDRPGADPVTASVRADESGQPVLLFASGSARAQHVTSHPGLTVCVPADPPFVSLALTGTTQAAWRVGRSATLACRMSVESVRFTGAAGRPVPLAGYAAARPDPFWRQAPGILAHLEQGHMAELLGCAQAHGVPEAQWVLPRRLDRFGIELSVLTLDGAVALRLAFPDAPVSSLDEIPASLRTVLTCCCQQAGRRRPRPAGPENR